MHFVPRAEIAGPLPASRPSRSAGLGVACLPVWASRACREAGAENLAVAIVSRLTTTERTCLADAIALMRRLPG